MTVENQDHDKELAASTGGHRIDPQTSTHFFEVRLPIGQQWETAHAAGLMEALYGLFQQVDNGVLTVRATTEGIKWVIYLGQEMKIRQVQSLVASFYPSATVLPFTDFSMPDFPFVRHWSILRLEAREHYAPFPSVQMHRRFDPLTLVAQAMGGLQEGEILTYDLYISPYNLTEKDIEGYLTISAWDKGYRATGMGYLQNGWDIAADVFGRWITNRRLKSERMLRLSEPESLRMAQRMQRTLALCNVVVTLETPYQGRGEQLMAVTGAIKSLSRGAENSLADGPSDSNVIRTEENLQQHSPETAMQILAGEQASTPELVIDFSMLSEEAALFWHLPHAAFDRNLLGWDATPQVAASKAVREIDKGMVIGVNRVGVEDYPILVPTDSRSSHTLIVGKTETGKSSLGHRMIHNDILDGRTVILIDEQGTLVQDVLQHSIPPSRENDVVVLSISNVVNGVFYPPPLNPLRASGTDAAKVAAGQLLASLQQTYPELVTQEMGDTLHSALLTLSEADNPTLLDIRRLLRDPGFRAPLVAKSQNPVLKEYWAEFDALSEKQQRALLIPVIRRLRGLYGNPNLLAMTCHPEPIDMDALIRGNKIVLVSLQSDRSQITQLERHLLAASLIT